VRLVAAVALGTSALSLASPAGADTKASIACRGAISKAFSKVANTGFKLNDTCHKTADKAMTVTGACNNVSNSAFDPNGKYGAAKAKASNGISAKCLSGDPVLNNYDGKDPNTPVGDAIDQTVGGNSALVVGFEGLAGDKAKTKCIEAIGKARTAIVKEVLKNSTKCQGLLDKSATTFGALDPSCVDMGAKSTAKAALKIPASCGALAGSDVGSCSPLPGCVTDATVTAAQGVAKAIYSKTTPPSPCGNGTLDPGEQCDDGASNGTPGDPCNAKCESLAETCGPGTSAGGAFIGHRIVTVSLNVPGGKQLAGVQVGFDYPQLEASIKGTGTSSVVQSSFQVVATPPASGFLSLANDTDLDTSILITSGTNFMGSGPVVTATLDECVGLSHNICNRSQNVIDCCPPADIVACNASPDDPVACFCGAVGKVSQTDCSLGDGVNPCTAGVCVGIPPGNPGDCDPTTKKCIATSANPGKACKVATETSDCSGVAIDQATCTASAACARMGDQTNGTYGCLTIFNPVGAPIGSFPPVAVGPARTSGPPPLAAGPGACPTNNTCEDQAQLTEASCTVTSPTDQLGQLVDGVTCSITVTEGP
jgi:cysteine-rich repeat protein